MKKTVKLIVSIFTIITMLMIIPIISINQYYTYKVEAANIKLNYTKRTMYVVDHFTFLLVPVIFNQ